MDSTNLSKRILHIAGAEPMEYGRLQMTHRGRTQTLDMWLAEEKKQGETLSVKSKIAGELLCRAHTIIERFAPTMNAKMDTTMAATIGAADGHAIDEEYNVLLDALNSDLLGSARARHSPQALRFMKLGTNYLIRSHRRFVRKNGSLYAVHPYMVASLAAAEGADFPTIVAAMMHDRIEESISSYTKHLGAKNKFARKRAIDDRASGILYSTGLSFYEQVRHFTFAHRYFADINSLLDIVDKLSRTTDQMYYEYLEKLFYPKVPKRRRMPFEQFRTHLDFGMTRAIDALNSFRSGAGDELVHAFLRDIDEYYTTYLCRKANEPSPEEMQHDMYRSMIVKLADRIHNTRDMDASCFSVPKRLYGIGFKNAYFVQHLDHKLLRQRHRTLDMAIGLHLIMDLRLATLRQLLDDEARLCSSLEKNAARNIEQLVEEYKKSPAFRQVTPASRGSPLDGLLELYNTKVHGSADFFSLFDGKPDLQYLHVLAFRSLFENYIAYAAGYGPEPRFYVSNFGLGFADKGTGQKNEYMKTTLRRIVG